MTQFRFEEEHTDAVGLKFKQVDTKSEPGAVATGQGLNAEIKLIRKNL